jgi:hypothetical protein
LLVKITEKAKTATTRGKAKTRRGLTQTGATTGRTRVSIIAIVVTGIPTGGENITTGSNPSSLVRYKN